MKNIKVKYWDVFKPGMFPLVIYREDACDYLYSKKKYLRDLEQNHDNVFYSKVTLNFVTSNDLLYSET